MPEELRFLHGSRYAELFETSQGLVIVEGLVTIEGGTVQLSDLLVEAFHAPTALIGVPAVLAIRRELLRQVSAEGYTVLELTGFRISGAHPFRPVRLRRVP